MTLFTATEEAYKKGHRDGVYAGKFEAGNTSAWGSGTNPHRPCLRCGNKAAPTKFCPECGAAMANPWPASET